MLFLNNAHGMGGGGGAGKGVLVVRGGCVLLSPICLANMTVIGLMAAPKIQLKRLDMSHIGT